MVQVITVLSLWISFTPVIAYAESPEYKAWKYSFDCRDLVGKVAAQAEWAMGLKYFTTEVYVELERAGFKYTKSLLRAESMAKVLEMEKRLTWANANRSKFKSESELMSAARRAFPDESVGRYMQAEGMIDLKALCSCDETERRKLIPDEVTFQKRKNELPALDVKMKASCVRSHFKSGRWF